LSYVGDALSLASFRESSELEFGADDAFILAPDGDDAELITLKHLKSRHGEQRDIALTFDKTRQSFSPSESTTATAKPNGKLQTALSRLWDGTATATDDGGDDDGF
jgi:replicative DNA helicase